MQTRTLAVTLGLSLAVAACGNQEQAGVQEQDFDQTAAVARPNLPELVAVGQVEQAQGARVVQAIPNSGTAGVAADELIKLTFSTGMDPAATLSATELLCEGLVQVTSPAWDASRQVLVLTPVAPMSGDCAIQVNVSARSSDGLELAEPFVGEFSVARGPAFEK